MFSQTLSFLVLLGKITLNVADELNSDTRPNIIFMFADDWGYNDAPWTTQTKLLDSNTNTRTPFLNELVSKESILLSNNYVTPLCSTSRAAFLTGRYPFRYGLQHSVVKTHSKFGLSLQESLLSDELKNNGYKTALIGKWHLGYLSKEYTPNYRSFDEFYGFYLSHSDYFDHTYTFPSDALTTNEIFCYKDLRINEQTADSVSTSSSASDFDDFYGPEWQRDRLFDVLDNYLIENENKLKINDINIKNKPSDSNINNINNNNDPFFIYIGWQASHSPSESKKEYFESYNVNKVKEDELNESEIKRFNMQAQTSSLDSIMSEVVSYLKNNNLWDNTLIVFSSDNGGETNYGDNAPLRGSKATFWEGGIKVPGFITGGLIPIQKRGTIFDDIVYVCDWYPTLLSIANIDYTESKLIESSLDKTLDGYNLHSKLFALGNNGNSGIDVSKFSKFSNQKKSDLNSLNNLNTLKASKTQSEINTKTANANDIDSNNEREIVFQIDSMNCEFEVCGVIREGNYKYMIASDTHLVGLDTDLNYVSCFWDRTFARDTHSSNGLDLLQCGKAPKTSYDLGFESDNDYLDYVKDTNMNNIDLNDVLACSESNCFTANGCLYDLSNDPCEYNDISLEKQDVVNRLKQKLVYYAQNIAVTPLAQSVGELDMDLYDSESNLPPMISNDGYWSPWMDSNLFENNELEFEKVLRQEKEEMMTSDVTTKQIVGEMKTVDTQDWLSIALAVIVGSFALCVCCRCMCCISNCCIRMRSQKQNETLATDENDALLTTRAEYAVYI